MKTILFALLLLPSITLAGIELEAGTQISFEKEIDDDANMLAAYFEFGKVSGDVEHYELGDDYEQQTLTGGAFGPV